ncbi:hypothetical protein L195_g053456 [Trifolium pratense]|uniref:Uncharacterized protein n=1 Tax=Trifolium pratense TaxID=57577 RepID=A0A2K3KAL4_TRIPR|nr:hypothetical protein L195_g053456 [Trifolium pratense]
MVAVAVAATVVMESGEDESMSDERSEGFKMRNEGDEFFDERC